MTQSKPVEAEFEISVTTEQLTTIKELASEQMRLETEIDTKEEELKQLKQELSKVQQNLLPDAVSNAGLSEFKTTAGDVVTIKEDLSVSVPKGKITDIAAWLESNQHGDIIGGKVYVELPKNSHNERQAAITALVDAGFEPIEEVTINTATLKSILKKHLAKGENINLEDFGAFAWRKSLIKRK